MRVNEVLIHTQVYIKTHELQKQPVTSGKVYSWEMNRMFILDNQRDFATSLVGANFFRCLQEKGLSKQSYWVHLFHVFLVGRCTGDLIIA